MALSHPHAPHPSWTRTTIEHVALIALLTFVVVAIAAIAGRGGLMIGIPLLVAALALAAEHATT